MSRIGKLPVPIPAGVEVRWDEAASTIHVQGPKGALQLAIRPKVEVSIEGNQIVLRAVDQSREARSLHGLYRSLIANMVTGVTEGFVKSLDLIGVGYKAELKGEDLFLSVGYASPVRFRLPKGIKAKVEQTKIVLESCDRGLVGEVAAEIRKIRPPDPYKGKGIRFSNEDVRLKPGKTGS
ncbi:MAG: 50S ribosomal protein L6 [Deltaproteobacteria bacterium]|nr:MAG: 50S ribosomal protein L6 [Deltaproteobacteria bacterium]